METKCPCMKIFSSELVLLLIYTAGSQKLNDYENSNSLTAYHRIALGLREVSDISQLGSDLGPFVLR